ncbi:hypothetical protein CaCOL14_004878 [Colletotrichum acutatum]
MLQFVELSSESSSAKDLLSPLLKALAPVSLLLPIRAFSNQEQQFSHHM